jgi:hypothetical protein
LASSVSHFHLVKVVTLEQARDGPEESRSIALLLNLGAR